MKQFFERIGGDPNQSASEVATQLITASAKHLEAIQDLQKSAYAAWNEERMEAHGMVK